MGNFPAGKTALLLVLLATASTPAADVLAPRSAAEYNLHVQASETLANRLLARQHTDTGEVRDVVLGAQVFGMQTTDTVVTVDFQPNATCAQFDFQLAGLTHSDTVGVTRQVTVNTLGRHRFWATKQVYFDARYFSTKTATARVAAHNVNRAAVTPASGMPLVGPLAEQFVMRAADERRPLAETIAAWRLTDKLLPEFNRSLDEQLAAANHQWNANVRTRLEDADLIPARQLIATTETGLCYSALFGSATEEVNGAGPPRGPDNPVRPSPQRLPTDMIVRPTASLTLAVHETCVNNLIDRLKLEGKPITDRQLADLAARIEALLPTSDSPSIPPQPATAESDSEPSPAEIDTERPQLVTILYDQTDPVRIRFADSRMIITLRAGFQLPIGVPVPAQRITIPLEFKPTDGKWLLKPGEIEVVPLEQPAIPDPLMLVPSLIRQQIEERVKPLRLKRVYPLTFPGTNRVSLSLREIATEDGWLIVAFD